MEEVNDTDFEGSDEVSEPPRGEVHSEIDRDP